MCRQWYDCDPCQSRDLHDPRFTSRRCNALGSANHRSEFRGHGGEPDDNFRDSHTTNYEPAFERLPARHWCKSIVGIARQLHLAHAHRLPNRCQSDATVARRQLHRSRLSGRRQQLQCCTKRRSKFPGNCGHPVALVLATGGSFHNDVASAAKCYFGVWTSGVFLLTNPGRLQDQRQCRDVDWVLFGVSYVHHRCLCARQR